jgi:succinate dehydrogenase / fumarate reductase cytochrome b subunit
MSMRVRFWSSIGKKLVTGATGVALVVFIIGHVTGNLTLFISGDAFNSYAHHLQSYGILLYVAEVGLVGFIALHAFSAVSVWRDKGKARSVSNSVVESKGAPSRQTVASRTMIYSGLVLLGFIVVHLIQFRFGPAESAGYVTMVHGEPARDLYRLVVETFKHLPWVVGYMAVMVFLGFHLRHGVWSAFQSLGLLNPRGRAILYPAGLVAGVLIAAAFVLMPLYLYLFAPLPPAGVVGLVPHP